MMTQVNNLPSQTNHPIPLGRLLLIGGAIGLAIISFFVFGTRHPLPEWGRFWMIRPLIITPLAGAAGAYFFYLMDHLRMQGGWKKAAANAASFLVFFIGLWMGIVLGLADTLWD